MPFGGKVTLQILLCMCVLLLTARRLKMEDAAGDGDTLRQADDDGLLGRKTIWIAILPPGDAGEGVPFCATASMQQCRGQLAWGRSIEGELEGEWLKHGNYFLPIKMSGSIVLKQLPGQQWRCIVNTPVKVLKKPDLSPNSVTRDLVHPGELITVLDSEVKGQVRFLKMGHNQWVPSNRPYQEGSGNIFHRFDVLPHTILGNRKHITVVGCGIAGIVTALELGMRPDVGEITVMDREATCAAGTSGRIAAELMFYNFQRDLFNKGEYSFDMTWQKIWNAQASVHQSAWGKLWDVYQSAKSAKGQRKTVTCDEKCLKSLTWKWSPFGAPEIDTVGPPMQSYGWPAKGDILASVAGKTPHQIWETIKGWQDVEESIRDSQVNARVRAFLGKKIASLTFQRGGDVRMLHPFQAAFFEQAAENMNRLIVHYPALCEAVITPACCEHHSTLIAQKDWGYGCDQYLSITADRTNASKVDPGMGMAEVFMTRSTERNAKSKGWVDNAHEFEVWGSREVQSYLKTYIDADTQYGAAVNRLKAGFVRTEDLGRVFQQIMAAKGHRILLNIELTETVVTDNGQLVLQHQEVFHDWQYTAGNLLELRGWTYGRRAWHAAHGVVVCTGATPKAVANMDHDVHSQLMPAFGNIVVGPPNKVPLEERRMGVVLEEFHMYLRSTKDGRLAVGGGVWMSWWHDDAVRRLPYKDYWDVHGEFWGTSGDSYMRQASIGRWLVNQSLTQRKGGARPMSHFINFPLIKLHPWAPVVFNSGGGVNGFAISWKSGQIAADLVLSGHVLDGTGAMWQGGRSWSYMSPSKASGAQYVPSTEWEVIADEGVGVCLEKSRKKSCERVLETIGTGGIVYGYAENGDWLVVRGNGGNKAYMPIKGPVDRVLIRPLT